MYPCPNNPTYGIFVKEQEDALTKEYPSVKYTIFYIDGKKSKFEYLKSIYQIHNLINKQDFDLIHIHYGFSGLFLLLKNIKKKIPILMTLHGGDIQVEQGKKIQVYFTKKILKKVDAAITLNQRMDNITKQYINRTFIIPCSVDTEIFYPDEKTTKSINLSQEINIIFPSDKTRYVKNYPLFEKVIGVLKTKYQIKCTTYEIKNMDRKQVADLYRKSDLMIMTSISEGSPQVVKEAMACNLPVISTNVGDVENLLYNVKNSAVVQSMSEEELADLA